MRLNLEGNEEALKSLLARWKYTEVTDRFSKTDINIDIHDDYVDDLYEAAEDANVKVTMVG